MTKRLEMRWWHVLSGLALFGLTLKMAVSGLWLPAVKPASVPPDEFSAERAVHGLRRILGDESPHPLGTDASFRVRDRILDEFRASGLSPEVQSGWAAGWRLAFVQNIVATLHGKEPGSAVLVSAHYDSVAAGPGAADDGLGAAVVMEVARSLKNAPQPRNTVVFLISDGEEFGWLGATEYARRHPWGGEYKAVVNLDGNEGTGPIWISDTGHENARLAPVLARSVKHPLLFLDSRDPPRPPTPNGSDFPIYRDQGWQGFALQMRDRSRTYHTPLNNIAHIDWRTVQHAGDTMLPLVLALAEEDLSHPSSGRVVMMDLLGWKVLYWPVGWNYAMLLAAAVLFGAALWRLARSGRLARRRILRCAAPWLLMTAVAIALSAGIYYSGVQPEPWASAVVWIAVAAVGFAFFLWLNRSTASWEAWTVVMAVLLLTGAATFTFASALGHQPLLPVIAGAAVVLWPKAKLGNPWTLFLAAILPVVTIEIFLAYLLVAGLDLQRPGPGGVLLILMAGPMLCLLPDLDRRATLYLAGVAALLASTAFVIGQSRDAMHCSLRYFQDANTGRAEWQVFAENPESIRLPRFKMATFGRASSPRRSWDVPVFAAPAATVNLDAPELRILERTRDGQRWKVRAHLQSSRTPGTAMVLFPPEAHLEQSEAMDRILRPNQWRHGWKGVMIQNVPAGGLELKFTLVPAGLVAVDVVDFSFELPDSGRPLQRERSRFAVPYGIGDTTMVSKTIELLRP